MYLTLFKYNKISANMERDFGNMISRDSTPIDIDLAKQVLYQNGLSSCTIDKCLNSSRKFDNILNLCIDSHYYLEYYGLSTRSKSYIMDVDLTGCLDLVLSILSGCDPSNVASMKDYDKISKSLMTLDLDNLDISLSLFTSLDPKLTKFLYDKVLENLGSEKGCISSLLNDMYLALMQILKYVAYYIQYNTDFTIRSLSRGHAVLTSNTPIAEDSIDLEYTSIDRNTHMHRLPLNIERRR